MNPKSIPVKNTNIVARKTGEECILVPVIDNIADMEAVYTLNETAKEVWEAIDGELTIEMIAKELTKIFAIDAETALNDTIELIKDLKHHGIVSE